MEEQPEVWFSICDYLIETGQSCADVCGKCRYRLYEAATHNTPFRCKIDGLNFVPIDKNGE